MEIKYQLKPAAERRSEQFCPEGNVGFGRLRTDHMFMMDYYDGEWRDPRIVPYGPFEMAPGAMALHYGQSIFEGAKAFMHEDGEIYTFRLNKNAERMNRSADIVCIPNIDEAMQLKAINALIDVDRLWFPMQDGACLYIRPFIFATEDRLSVSPANRYTFCVVMSPSGAYYGESLNAIRLLISKEFHRAVSGGTGASKAAGNYAASLRAGKAAAAHGASQVLYLDSTNEYIEEAGAMNHFHILKDGTVIILSLPIPFSSRSPHSLLLSWRHCLAVMSARSRSNWMILLQVSSRARSSKPAVSAQQPWFLRSAPTFLKMAGWSLSVTARSVNMSVASTESSPKSRKGTDKAHKVGFAKYPGWRRHKPITNY